MDFLYIFVVFSNVRYLLFTQNLHSIHMVVIHAFQKYCIRNTKALNIINYSDFSPSIIFFLVLPFTLRDTAEFKCNSIILHFSFNCRLTRFQLLLLAEEISAISRTRRVGNEICLQLFNTEKYLSA